MPERERVLGVEEKGEQALNEKEEAAYVLGHRRAWLELFEKCLRELGYGSSEAAKARWIKERESIVAALRRICSEHGDNEWEPDLHLGDVIEKHLEDYLRK